MKQTCRKLLAVILVLSFLAVPAFAYEKLQRKDSGNDVYNMQLALSSLGYYVEADGKFGYATEEAVKAFQRNYGLSVDGVAGNQTLSLLYTLAPSYAPGAAANQPTPAPASSPSGYIPSSSVSGTATVRTSGGALSLRNGPSTDAGEIGYIPNGDMVIVINQSGAWTSVIYNGQAGYVMTAYLAFTGFSYQDPTPTPTASPTPGPTASWIGGNVSARVSTYDGSLNLRESADAGSRVLAEIPNGTIVTVLSQGVEWCAVRYGNWTGFVMTKYLSFGNSSLINAPVWQSAATPDPSSSQINYQDTVAYVSTTGGSLNLRQTPSTSAKVLRTIPNGTAVSLMNRGDIWCAVAYLGTRGYVMTAFLRFSDPAPTLQPTQAPTPRPDGGQTVAWVTTQGGSLNLRAEGRMGGRVITTIPNGTRIDVITKGSVWSAVLYGGQYGYVMSSFLSFSDTPAPTATPAVTPAPTGGFQTELEQALVTTSGGTLNLRSEASSNARVLLKIPNASAVIVYSRGETWSQVMYNNSMGYVMSRYLTFLGPAVTPTADPNEEEDDPAAFTRILKKGMTGADVTWVQNRLKELGYTVAITNLYDDATFSAVKAFQTQNGLEADGLAGSQTFAVLRSENARRAGAAPLTYSTLRIDDTGDGVRQIQTDLKNLGYNVSVNGTYDVDTHNAVVAFQQRNGLVISGIADSLTRQVLHGGGGKPYSTPVAELPANEGWIAGPSVSDLKLLHWQNEIKPTVKAGQTFTIFDPNTHLSWKLVFYSLGRHADSQPASWRDTRIMNRSFGDTSWTIHPVYVQLPDGQWTMATMHNRPHLYGSISDNGFGGHLCVHFLRDMEEAKKNDPNYGVNNQITLRSAWKALTGQTVD